MKNKKTIKPMCKLIGTDGNVFSIIHKVSSALKKAGQKDLAVEFTDKACACKSYNDVLVLVFNYVNVK